MEASGSGSVQIMTDPGCPKTYDPDPQHWINLKPFDKNTKKLVWNSKQRIPNKKTTINWYVAEGTWKWRGFWRPWGGRPAAADTSRSRAGRDGPAASGTAPRHRSDRNPPGCGKEEKPVRDQGGTKSENILLVNKNNILLGNKNKLSYY
jgi:hypothetical protein